MARRRMIDPNIWASQDVEKLNHTERLLFIGMISNADDYGKGVAKPEYLRSIIFPYEDIHLSKIKKGLEQIGKYIKVIFFEIDGNSYYKFTNWGHWQRVDHPQKSTIPDPESGSNSENDSENGSKNDSENQSKNDSTLKEFKVKEDKIKEVKEGIDPQQIQTLFIKTFGCNPLQPEYSETELLIKKYSYKDVEEAFHKAVLNGVRKLSYVKGILKKQSTESKKTDYTNPIMGQMLGGMNERA